MPLDRSKPPFTGPINKPPRRVIVVTLDRVADESLAFLMAREDANQSGCSSQDEVIRACLNAVAMATEVAISAGPQPAEKGGGK